MACTAATVSSMDESLRFTIVYENGGEGWIMARVVEVPQELARSRRLDALCPARHDSLRRISRRRGRRERVVLLRRGESMTRYVRVSRQEQPAAVRRWTTDG